MRSKTLARAASAQWLFVAVAVLLTAAAGPAPAGAITGMDVARKPDRVVITVRGDSALSFVPISSTAGRYLGFQFPRTLAVKGRIVPIRSGGIYNVRYSNFRAKPPLARIVVNTTSHLDYATHWSPDRRRVEIHVMKRGAKPAKANLPRPPHPELVEGRKEGSTRNFPPCEGGTEESESSFPPCEGGTEGGLSLEPAPLTVAAPAEKPKASPADRGALYKAIAEKSRQRRAAASAVPSPQLPTPSSDPVEPGVRVMGLVETAPTPAGAGPPEPQPEARVEPSPPVPVPVAIAPPARTERASGDRKVSLNFLAADINDVLKALSVQSGKNIVAGKDVTGNVTVSLSNVGLEEALDYVAKLSGYVYTKSEDTYLVSTKESLRVLISGSGPESKTELIKLSYAKADDVIALLKAQFPDVAVNKVGVEATGKGTAESRSSQTTIGQKNNLLVLVGPSESVTAARGLAEQFETTLRVQAIESTRGVYRAKYANPKQLAEAVAALVPGIEVVFGPSSDFDLVKFKSAKSASTQAPQVQREFDNTGRASAAGAGAGGGPGGAGGQGDGDKPGDKLATLTNARTLMIVGDEKSVEKALEIAAQLDVKSPQIKIDAKITSISQTGEKKLGFKWEWGDFAAVEGFTDFDKTTDMASSPENKQNVKVPHDQLIRQPWGFTAALEALVTSGDAELLASPSIVCLERNPGVFFVGQEVTYIQLVQTTPTGQNILTDTKRVGVQMVVVGEINADGYVTLYLHPEVSTLKLTVEQGVTLPIVSSRFTDHVVRVKTGETIVIGGLIRNDEIEELRKVPLLGDVPLLGNLFRHKGKTKDHTEVVMFITASILQD